MIGRCVDFVISRLFTNTFSCVSVRFSPRLELDVAVVCPAPEASLLPCHDSRRLACRVISRPHHRCRSLPHPGSRVHVLLVLLGDLLHHRLSSTSASVGSR